MRRPRTRWVVHVVAQDNGQIETFGPWHSYDKAREVSNLIAAKSAYYHGDEQPLDVTVQMSVLDPWPGIRAFMRGTK